MEREALRWQIVKLSRRQDYDKPQIVFLSLVGNDVCNGHYPTESHMTTVERYTEKTRETLAYLDTILPAGSNNYDWFVDGRVLWDNMAHRIHPLGEYHNDTYEDVYEYLNCLQISPCHGWPTPMPICVTLPPRELWTWVLRLRKSPTLAVQQFRHDLLRFRYHYFYEALEEQGGEGWHLIDPVDGFHPHKLARQFRLKSLESDYARSTWHFGWGKPIQRTHHTSTKDAFGLKTCDERVLGNKWSRCISRMCILDTVCLGVEGDSVDIVSTIGLTADWAGCIGFVFGEPVGRTVMAQMWEHFSFEAARSLKTQFRSDFFR